MTIEPPAGKEERKPAETRKNGLVSVGSSAKGKAVFPRSGRKERNTETIRRGCSAKNAGGGGASGDPYFRFDFLHETR